MDPKVYVPRVKIQEKVSKGDPGVFFNPCFFLWTTMSIRSLLVDSDPLFLLREDEGVWEENVLCLRNTRIHMCDFWKSRGPGLSLDNRDSLPVFIFEKTETPLPSFWTRVLGRGYDQSPETMVPFKFWDLYLDIKHNVWTSVMTFDSLFVLVNFWRGHGKGSRSWVIFIRWRPP